MRGVRMAAVLLVALAFAGCEPAAESVLAPETAGAPLFGVNNDRPLPITGWFEGSPLDANEIPWGHDLSVICPAGYSHGSEVRGEGELSHLGRTEIRVTVCTRLTGLTPTTFLLGLAGGQAVFSAANGDQLITDVVGTAVLLRSCAGLSTFDVTTTIRGGTGRFAAAQGSVRWTATQVPGSCPTGSTPPRLSGSFSIVEGSISNVGHPR